VPVQSLSPGTHTTGRFSVLNFARRRCRDQPANLWGIAARPLDLDELVDHFTLDPDELKLLRNKTGATRLGFALLRYLAWKGRFPAVAATCPTTPSQRARGTGFLFELSWKKPYSTRGAQAADPVRHRGRDPPSGQPHHLRHFLLSWLKAQGINDALVQPYSGHEHQQSLEVYSRLSLANASNATTRSSAATRFECTPVTRAFTLVWGW